LNNYFYLSHKNDNVMSYNNGMELITQFFGD